MEELVGQAPAILAEAAKSALGVFALMILALSVIGFVFFRSASERTRVSIFVLMLVGVASFGAATVRTTGGRPSPEPAPSPADVAAVAGEWSGEVTYAWGDTYDETFSFDVLGSDLVGTATYLGVPRGILEGEIEGGRITFSLQLEEIAGAERRSYRNEYLGRVSEDGIRFTMRDTRGYPPVEFRVVREAGR